MGVHFRPYLIETLTKLSKDWEIITFVGSASEYASKIIHQIDPDGKLISFKLFRDHCYSPGEKNLKIKDLRIIDRPLS